MLHSDLMKMKLTKSEATVVDSNAKAETLWMKVGKQMVLMEFKSNLTKELLLAHLITYLNMHYSLSYNIETQMVVETMRIHLTHP